jgi:hypothetical protein
MKADSVNAESVDEYAHALAGRVDLLDVLVVHGDSRRSILLQDLRAAQDDGEQVVEVVRDAAGQTSHRLHLLRLLKLDFELGLRLLCPLALGDVRNDAVPQGAAILHPFRVGLRPTPAQTLPWQDDPEFAIERLQGPGGFLDCIGYVVVVVGM